MRIDAVDVLQLLLSLSLRAAVPATLAVLATLIRRFRLPQARHALWTAVLFSMLLQVPLHPVLPPLPLHVLKPALQRFDIAGALPRAIPPPAVPAPRRSPWPPTPEQLILFVYGAGVLFGLVRLAAGYRFTGRILRDASPVAIPDAPAPILESASIAVPMTNGWFQPRILLPITWREWDQAKLGAVLAHEQAHIRRRDWPIAVLARLNRAIFWFHPLAWWLERHLASLAEQACDDAAIANTGDRHRYAQALVEIAQDLHASSGRFLLTAMAKNAAVHERIDSILDETRPLSVPLRRRFWISLAGCTIACLYLTASVRLAPAQEPVDTPYMRWLTQDVVYIISGSERHAFLRLNTDAERAMFIEQFWLRRDPTPGTPANEFKQEHYRRISYGNERFRSLTGIAGWKTDRGRIYIVYGPPDEIESHPSGGSHKFLTDMFGAAAGPAEDTSPYDVWHYKAGNLWFGFIDKQRNGNYQIVSNDIALDFFYTREPEYTEAARAARIQGTVVLGATVDADGKLQNIRIIQSLDPGLDQKAIECVRDWKVAPKVPRPSTKELNVSVHFHL